MECLNRFQKVHGEYQNVPLSYVGRLDPMAEGLMLVVAGEENKNREKYLGLDKSYSAHLVFGFTTDTYDLLGVPPRLSATPPNTSTSSVQDLGGEAEFYFENAPNALKKYLGEHEEEYPPFSSKTVEGKPLFEWAREGKLNEIEIPKRIFRVDNIGNLSWYTISGKELLEMADDITNKMKGDFRQKEIADSWRALLEKKLDERFYCLSFDADVGSGTYIRSLVNNLGKDLGGGAVLIKLIRTRIGENRVTSY